MNIEMHNETDDLSKNPCGHLCKPFNHEYCLLYSTKDPVINEMIPTVKNQQDPFDACLLAQGLCRKLIETISVKNNNIELQDTLTILSKEKEDLHKDTLTGAYSGKGFESILKNIYEPANIDRLLKRDHYVRIICADVNDLKLHNAGPGGHYQGDLAIKTVGKALIRFIDAGRRVNQVVSSQIGELIIRNERRKNDDIPTRFVTRSNDRGDEFIAVSIISKTGIKKSQNINDSLDLVLSNLHYEYDNQLYNVTATYGVITVKMPETLPAFHHVIKQIDTAMMQHKQKVKSGALETTSEGSALNARKPLGVVLDSLVNIDVD